MTSESSTDRSQVDNTTALIAEARERALMYTGGPEADRLWRLADALEASTSDHTDSEKALIDRVNELTVERDSLSALHEVATERTVALSAVIEWAHGEAADLIGAPGGGTDFADGQENVAARMVHILASAPGDVLREHDAKVWDEGYTRGFYDREGLSGDSRDASEGATDNPHWVAALRVGANPKENEHGR